MMMVMYMFQIGDVVYLKSGSPRMTVVSMHPDNPDITVAWVVYGTGELKHAVLPVLALKLATDDRDVDCKGRY